MENLLFYALKELRAMTFLKREMKSSPSSHQSLKNIHVESVAPNGATPGRGMGTCPAVGRRTSP